MLVPTERETKLNTAGVTDVVHVAYDQVGGGDFLQIFASHLPPEFLASHFWLFGNFGEPRCRDFMTHVPNLVGDFSESESIGESGC